MSESADYTIDASPSYSILKVFLEPGESITIEPTTYMMHKGDIDIKTSSRSILRGLARAALGGESFFLNTITAKTKTELWVAPGIPGDITDIKINNSKLFVRDARYLAHLGDIEVSAGWKGLKGLLAEGEIFMVKAEGTGTVFVNSYGAIRMLTLNPGEKAIIDNMHFVALEESVSWKIRKWGSLKSTIFGGTGLVVEVEGPGRVWVQTRNLPLFARLVADFLPNN